MLVRALLFALSLAGVPASATGQIQLTGTFTATKECAANKKLRSDNPGNINTEVGQVYAVLGQNKADATHFWLQFPGAPSTDRRWVAVDCGVAVVGPAGGGGGASLPMGGDQIAPDSIENVLAASWQPSFCATPNGRTKPECISQTPDRPDATQFSIHGLWPDDLDDKSIFPCYCDDGPPVGCRGRRPAVEAIALTQATRQRLNALMPGTQSGLHLHEWSKHGSCYEDFLSGAGAGADPEQYYLDTMAVLEQLNASAVRRLFEAHIGQELTGAAIKAAFDDAFGDGAGNRVHVVCASAQGRRVIMELWIGLAGEITEESDLGALILAAPTTANSTTRASCSGGLVVSVE